MNAAQIPFAAFVAVPVSAFAALSSNELTTTEFLVLLALYLRRRPERGLTVRVHDLDSLARSIAWPGKTDTLSKALRSLKTNGWIDFESVPGRKGHAYDIELRPDRSEHDPSSSGRSHAGFGDPAPEADPNRGLPDPSSEHAANPYRDGGSATVDPTPVRAGLDLSRGTTSLSEEDAGPARAREAEPDDEELNRLWAESATPSRGSGWEPNS